MIRGFARAAVLLLAGLWIVAPAWAQAPITGGTIAETTAAWTSATSANTALTQTVTGFNSVTVFLNQGTTLTGGVVTFEVSDTAAFTNAYPLNCTFINGFTVSTTYTFVASTNQAFQCDVTAFVAFRVRLSTVISGTGTVNVGLTVNALPDPNEMAVGFSSAQPVNQSQIGGSTIYADPCQVNTPSAYVVNFATTTTTTMITGTASKQTYICGVFLIAGTATNINIVEGTGTNCSTISAGLVGGTTAATGPNLAANSGFVMFGGGYWVAKTATAADNVCFMASAANQVSGVIKYVQQ